MDLSKLPPVQWPKPPKSERGAHHTQRKQWLYQHCRKQKWQCFYCAVHLIPGHPTKGPSLEHRMPISRGGADAFQNTVASCKKCNEAKADMLPSEFMRGQREVQPVTVDVPHQPMCKRCGHAMNQHKKGMRCPIPRATKHGAKPTFVRA